MATRAGWVGGSEAVEVSFDPRVLARSDLEGRVGAGCATRLFPAGAAFRLVEDQKHYLRATPLAAVPMTPAQAARAHGSAPTGNPEAWLSPRQRAALQRVRAAPQAAWPDVIGLPLAEAWRKFDAAARRAEDQRGL